MFTVNGAEHRAPESDVPLLNLLRNDVGLMGTRFGCGMAQCGACMVLLDGEAVTSCDLPVWAVDGKDVVTIEGDRRGRELTTRRRVHRRAGGAVRVTASRA